jgi:glutaminyl-tRNA synthetase
MRRRGYPPQAIQNFAETIGIAKRENLVDLSLLEFHVRETLNSSANRVMAVLDPLKLVLTNYPEGEEEWLEAENNPEDDSAGFRKVPFSRELLIEREDFKEEASGKFFRLKIGSEVRLKNGYIVKADSCLKDENGTIIEVHATYDPNSKSGSGTPESLRKVKGTLHWVSAKHAFVAPVRLYDRLFTHESPDTQKDKDFMSFLNPDSLKIVRAYCEPSLAQATPGETFQFQRLGYFTVDTKAKELTFNRTTQLRDTWAKLSQED